MTERPSTDPRDIWRQGQYGAPRAGVRAGPMRQQRGGRRPPRRRWPAVAGYGGLALACLCLATVAFLLVAPPLDAVRERLIERVKARTGAALAIAGPASLSLFPRPVVSFSDVALLGPDGKQGPPIATVPSLQIEVSLWSLLVRQPRVGRLTLRRPTIELSIDAEGRGNWEFAGKRASAPAASMDGTVRRATGSAKPVASKRPAATAARRSGGSVHVIDATLRYRDERSGSRYEVGALNLNVAADGPESPVEVDGTLVWRRVRLGFSATALPLRATPADRSIQLSLKIVGAPVEAGYEGSLALDGGFAADGKLRIQARSAQALGEWLGAALPAGSAAGALVLSTGVKSADSQVTLSPIEASLGDAVLAGSLAVDLGGRPKVAGKLRLSELDLGTLFALVGKRPRIAPPPASDAAAPLEAERRAGRKRWSEDPIDPQRLAAADAELALSVERLVFKDVKTGQSTLSVTVDSGLAKVVLETVQLYGGRGQGKVTLDGTGRELAVAADLKLAGVSVRPLLGDAAGVGWLDGRGTVALAVTGRGLSERQIIEALDGKADLAVAEGAITGIDIGKIVGALQHGRLPSLVPAPQDRTPFSELAGSFDVAKGVARSRDLKLVSKHLGFKGEGAIELGPRRIDYTLHAKIVGGPPAEGAAVRIGTLELPIGIKGPLEAPAFTIMGQDALAGAIRQIGKNLKSREVRDAIEGLLSGDRDKRVDPRDLIEKLLKKE